MYFRYFHKIILKLNLMHRIPRIGLKVIVKKPISTKLENFEPITASYKPPTSPKSMYNVQDWEERYHQAHKFMLCPRKKKTLFVLYLYLRGWKSDGSNDEQLLYFRLCAALEEFDYFSVFFPQAWSDLFPTHTVFLSPNNTNNTTIPFHTYILTRPTWKISIEKTFRWPRVNLICAPQQSY